MSVRTRYKHGVTIHATDKVCPGYVLFTPTFTTRKQMQGTQYSTVYLIDQKGDIVHYWKVPGMVKLHGELLDNGHLLCAVDDLQLPKTLSFAFSVHALLELDWDSNVVWRYDDEYMDCHDRCRLRNGNTLIQRYQKMDPALQARVQGGVPGTENKGIATKENADDFGWRLGNDQPGDMYTLALQEITPAGQVIWEMNCAEALDPEIDIITPYAGRELWPGLNSIEEMPDGNIISTSYNLSTIFIWDRASKTVKWRFGNRYRNPTRHRLSFPHDPTVLPNGHIMCFDNGRFHCADPDGSMNLLPPDFSRVIEIDPAHNEIVWEYRAEDPVDFYSTYISSAQRLSNGNTIICEGALGRFFEVTQAGETVWEYVSPIYTESVSRFGKTSNIFRCMKYEPDHPALKGRTFDLERTDMLNRLYGAEAYDV